MNILSWLGGVDNCRVEHLARLVNNSELTACTEAWVIAEHRLALQGRNQQKIAQIFGKNLERSLAGVVEQITSDFSFKRGENQALIAVLDCVHYYLNGRGLLVGNYA